MNHPTKRPPEQLPDPYLFNSESLLRELDRIREMVLLIPVSGDLNATHFAINNAIDAIWNLSQDLRYLLHLHRAGQRSFAKRAQPPAAQLNVVPKHRKQSAKVAQ